MYSLLRKSMMTILAPALKQYLGCVAHDDFVSLVYDFVEHGHKTAMFIPLALSLDLLLYADGVADKGGFHKPQSVQTVKRDDGVARRGPVGRSRYPVSELAGRPAERARRASARLRSSSR